MKITALVDNQAKGSMKAKHGLSLYIETQNHKILFDVGPDTTMFDNSEALGIDLLDIDTVIISHGHSDHGGALEQFLKLNHEAKVYVQRKAFEQYYSKVMFMKVSIGLVPHLKSHPQVILLDGDYSIDDNLKLFTTPKTDKYRSTANKTLYSQKGRDTFAHEQSLMILGDTNVLILGCGHTGAVNILDRAMEYKPKICVGGYHLWNPATGKTVSDKLLNGIAQELSNLDIRYYTCHCTGLVAFDYFKGRVPNMNYLHCGDSIEV